jgi:hypothetical protein
MNTTEQKWFFIFKYYSLVFKEEDPKKKEFLLKLIRRLRDDS